MTNAKAEFIDLVDTRRVLCAEVSTETSEFVLKVGHSPTEVCEFLDSLDFEYEDGFGGQELFGTVWFTDGTWATREEYDGSEWWEIHALPEIPGSLR